jgi:hypothetical protein
MTRTGSAAPATASWTLHCSHCAHPSLLHPPAQALLECRRSSGNGGREAMRILERRLSDVILSALRADQTEHLTLAA